MTLRFKPPRTPSPHSVQSDLINDTLEGISAGYVAIYARKITRFIPIFLTNLFI